MREGTWETGSPPFFAGGEACAVCRACNNVQAPRRMHRLYCAFAKGEQAYAMRRRPDRGSAGGGGAAGYGRARGAGARTPRRVHRGGVLAGREHPGVPEPLHDHYVVGALYASRRALTISAASCTCWSPATCSWSTPATPMPATRSTTSRSRTAARTCRWPRWPRLPGRTEDRRTCRARPRRGRRADCRSRGRCGPVRPGRGRFGARRARAAVRRSRAAGSRAVRAGGRVLQAGSTRGCTGARRARRFAARPSRRR